MNCQVTESSSNFGSRSSRKSSQRVALLHSDEYTKVLHSAMQYIHQDRDLLLARLLDYCGFLHETPKFLKVVKPKKATRQHLERFHHEHYLNVLEPLKLEVVSSSFSPELLASLGLTEDCVLPTSVQERKTLWEYCRHVVGASLQAVDLLATNQANVAINWGGGRHHAHADQAGGFCFVNDVVLAIRRLQKTFQRVLYMDIDIHHCDGVQRAFYDTDRVLTVSFHRHAPGFFPSTSGSVKEKGRHGTPGVGHNLNIPLAKSTRDLDFCHLFRYTLESLRSSYCPDVLVLTVGADGLKSDPLVGETDGWSLTPEGLAECVRVASEFCSCTSQREKSCDTMKNGVHIVNDDKLSDADIVGDCKLLILGGGGYNPVQTARTFLLATAAACEAARPGMMWKELPDDIPRHDYFPRYGPEFILIHRESPLANSEYAAVDADFISEAKKHVDFSTAYLRAQRKKLISAPTFSFMDERDPVVGMPGKSTGKKRARRKKRPLVSSAGNEE